MFVGCIEVCAKASLRCVVVNYLDGFVFTVWCRGEEDVGLRWEEFASLVPVELEGPGFAWMEVNVKYHAYCLEEVDCPLGSTGGSEDHVQVIHELHGSLWVEGTVGVFKTVWVGFMYVCGEEVKNDVFHGTEAFHREGVSLWYTTFGVEAIFLGDCILSVCEIVGSFREDNVGGVAVNVELGDVCGDAEAAPCDVCAASSCGRVKGFNFVEAECEEKLFAFVGIFNAIN